MEAYQMTLEDITKESIQDQKNDFLWYVKEIGVEAARKICLKETGFTEVREFINEYQSEAQHADNRINA